MGDKLTEICENRRAQVASEKQQTSLAELDRRAKDNTPPRGFARALQEKIQKGSTSSSFPRKRESSCAASAAQESLMPCGRTALDSRFRGNDENESVFHNNVGLICEIKKASPSAGLIRPDFNPATLAKAYEEGGAACLSVLTEETYFQGRNEYLITARDACALPALRKDFMVDVWQVAQARAIGADCILLIMAALDDALAAEMHSAATQYGMDVLIEVHDASEMDRALMLLSNCESHSPQTTLSSRTADDALRQTHDAGSHLVTTENNKWDSGSALCGKAAQLGRNDKSGSLSSTLIGINNRNLKTLTIDLATTETLVRMVPQGRLVVSESGLKTADDLRRMQAANVNAFLIGESLMRQADVAAAVGAITP